jgi:putative transposase
MKWIQRYRPMKIMQKSKRMTEFIIDETLIKAGGHEYMWLWIIAIEPIDKTIILGIRIPIERNMLIAEQFIKSLVKRYGKCNIPFSEPFCTFDYIFGYELN